MASRGILLAAALLLSCFLESSYGNIHFSTLPQSLQVTASPTPGQLLKAGEGKIKLTWVLNKNSSGHDSSYKTIKLKLCFAPISQMNRGWRKTEDNLAKDKTCSYLIVAKPYNPANKTVQTFDWTVQRDVPTASYFVRAYAFNAAGDEVAYGQTTDDPKKNNFQIQAITGRHVSLDIAAVCFSAFSVLSLFGFFIAEKRRTKSSQ